MDPEEVKRLVNDFQRSTQITTEEALILHDDDIRHGEKHLGNCLVAKILSPKQINKEVFKTHMPRILQASKQVVVGSLGDNIFLLDFKSVQDKNRALNGGPWNLFRDLVLFREPHGFQNPTNLKFDAVSLWVQCYNLPLVLMNKETLEKLGNQIGIVEEIDTRANGLSMDSYARVRIRMDVTKPLKKFICVSIPAEAESIIVPLVRSEAKKVHDLFFDILKIAFPDTEFREAKNSMSFSGPISTPASASRQMLASQTKRQKLVKDVDSDNGHFQKPQTRAAIHTLEDTKTRSYVTQKELRLGSSSSRELSQQDNAHPFTHPGDFVICKKKRKDREKTAVKAGNRSAGPLSPTGLGLNIKSPSSFSGTKDMGLMQQIGAQQSRAALSPQQGNSGGSAVGWANPVKRMRTDAGKRRPSHL